MWKALRRLFWLALIGGAGYGAYAAWQRNHEPQPDGPAEWPPIDDPTTPAPPVTMANTEAVDTSTEHRASGAEDADASQRWVAPVDGRCPPGYPIKGNDNSGIYHVPGGQFYDRTTPERCYANEDDAIADGYRRSKA